MFLTACGSGGLSGTYSDANKFATYTFKSNGKVEVTDSGGMGAELDYKVEDGKVKLITPQGTLVMPILDDGSIQSEGGKLVKQKS